MLGFLRSYAAVSSLGASSCSRPSGAALSARSSFKDGSDPNFPDAQLRVRLLAVVLPAAEFAFRLDVGISFLEASVFTGPTCWSITVDTYTQALGSDKRAVQSKVVGLIRPKERVFSVYRDAEGFSV